MNQHCQIPHCPNPTDGQAPMALREAGEEPCTLCAACAQAYTWGVRHGRVIAKPRCLWVAAVAYRGMVELSRACNNRQAAERAIVDHLITFHLYRGPTDFPSADAWVNQRNEDFDVKILEQDALDDGDDKLPQLLSALRKGFVVLTHNPKNARDAQFEAWAYEGPLDFEKSGPVRFGLGNDPIAALAALDWQLAQPASRVTDTDRHAGTSEAD